MFYLRFIGAVRFHKSWNAPTAKYSCPQLHHNYYALYPLRALSLVVVVLSSDITCSQEYILHYVRYICLHFRRTCLFEISNHDPSSLIKFDGIDSMIRLNGILFHDFLPFSFFFFLTEIHEKPRGSHKASLLSEERVSNTIFFSYVQPAKYKSWPTTRNTTI